MKLFSLCFSLLSLLIAPLIFAQNSQDQEVVSSTYCAPRIDGMPRSKGVLVDYESVRNFSLLPVGQNAASDENRTHVRANTRRQVKVKLPLYNKPHFKFILGYNYNSEQFDFEQFAASEEGVYGSVAQKEMRKMGLSAYFIKPFIGNQYFMLRTKVGLSGDFHENAHSLGDYLTYSITPLLGWKKNGNTSLGVGFSYNNTFGRSSIFPLLAYNHTFNKHLGIEATLPASVRLRWTINPKNLIYGTVKLDAASYRLSFQNGSLSDHELVELRRTELKYFLTYEREIYDFLWFGVSAGYRSSLSFNISENRFREGDILMENKAQMAPFVNFSLFLVPPKKFLK